MAAIDDFALRPDKGSGQQPIEHLFAVTPSDGSDLSHVTRAIYIGSTGSIQLTTLGGETVTLQSGVLSAGIPHPIRATRIWATGTSAGNIWAGY